MDDGQLSKIEVWWAVLSTLPLIYIYVCSQMYKANDLKCESILTSLDYILRPLTLQT